jgi:hypothetical protein
MHSLSIKDSDMDILMELSDNRGNSNSDLAIRLHKQESNLSPQLKRLSRDFIFEDLGEEEIHFSVEDIIDPFSLAAKLKEGTDSFSKFIISRFDSESIKTLHDSHVDYEIMGTLYSELNEIVDGPKIPEQYISKNKLSDRTKKLIKRFKLKPPLKNIDYTRFLNRFILEDEYPRELSSSRNSIKLNHLIYRLPEKVQSEDAPQPEYPERPYYINEDLDIFRIILEYFEDKSQEFDRYILELLRFNKKQEEKIKSSPDINSKELRERLSRIWKESKDRYGHNIYYWINESNKNFDRLEKFLASAYVGNLIKKFGIMEVINLLDFSGMEDMVRIKAIINAYEKQFISEDEYRYMLLNMDAAIWSEDSFLVKRVRLRRYEYDIPEESS